MNKVLYKQLKKCQCIDTSNISETDTEIVLHKVTTVPILESHCYIIELDDTLLDANRNSVLVVNWNAGSVPSNKYYKCEVVKKMSTYVKINGLAYDLENDIDINSMWTGWLPTELIKVIKEI